MKNYFFLTIIFILILIFSILVYFNYDQLFDLIFIVKKLSNNFLIVYFLFIFIYFLTPFPTTLIILLNGFLFEEKGFLISYFIIIISSIIIFVSSKNIKAFFKFKIKSDYLQKKINNLKFSQNNFSIFLSRFIVPFFFHNLFYGLTQVRFKTFFFIILLAEIPITYALNSIGKSLSEFNEEIEITIKEIFLNSDFYIPFIIIFVIFLITSKYKKNII